MKRMMTLVLAAALCLLVHPAMANSWGLSGALLSAVASTDDWNDYHAIGGQVGDAAVLHSRYHNVLAIVLEGELALFPTAVYQPQDGRDSSLRLSGSGESLTISYGDEQYVFEKEGTAYRLQSAVIGDFRLVLSWNQYLASEGSQSAILQQDVTLDSFNIRLFPRSLEEIRHLNFMHAALDSGEAVCGWWQTGEAGRRYEGVGRGTAAVYSAPFGENAWRAANGKAAVGLEGTFWGMHTVRGDGQDYACIRYDISNRTQRIGFVLQSALGQTEEACPEWTEKYVQVPVRARETTYLTDDPQVSQYAQFVVPEGTEMTCLALYAQEYAFVAADALVDDGSILWGFVPLRALELASEDVRQAVRHDVMAQMDGTWRLTAGGSMAAEELTLRADGTYVTYGEAPEEGVWYVTDYLAQWNLYWNDPPYELYLCGDDGSVNVRGLTLQEDGWSLSNWEGGGGWSRIDAP